MKEQVIKIVSQVMGVPVEQLNETSSPGNIQNWDSLKHINLIFSLEEAFDVTFSDDEITEMLSVGAIIKTLQKYQQNLPQA